MRRPVRGRAGACSETPTRRLPGTPLVFLAVDYDPLESGLSLNPGPPRQQYNRRLHTSGGLGDQAAGDHDGTSPTCTPPARLRRSIFEDSAPAVRAAAATAGVQLNITELGKAPYDLEAAFAEAAKASRCFDPRLASPVLASNARQLAALQPGSTVYLRWRRPAATSRLACS